MHISLNSSMVHNIWEVSWRINFSKIWIHLCGDTTILKRRQQSWNVIWIKFIVILTTHFSVCHINIFCGTFNQCHNIAHAEDARSDTRWAKLFKFRYFLAYTDEFYSTLRFLRDKNSDKIGQKPDGGRRVWPQSYILHDSLPWVGWYCDLLWNSKFLKILRMFILDNDDMSNIFSDYLFSRSRLYAWLDARRVRNVMCHCFDWLQF